MIALCFLLLRVDPMPAIDLAKMDELKQIWTDRYVQARSDRPELKRFEGRVGRIVTVNLSGKAIVDFADGAWYDIPASEEYLTIVSDEAVRKTYDSAANSAQAHPTRQG
jgi:hypothetical protein